MKKLIYSQEDLDLILTLKLEEKDEEIERLNNIINELEKYINEVKESYGYELDITDRIEKMTLNNVMRKLQELKGDSSNE